MPADRMNIDRVTAAIGAVVSGVDLRAPLSDEAFAGIRNALAVHQVLFFRDQDLDDDQHRAFASRFGTLGVDAVARLTGDNRDLMYIEDKVDSPPNADKWHTDISWLAKPPSIGMLNARVIPPFGGDTMWASLFGAYDALSPTMQAFCDGLTVVHQPTSLFLDAATRAVGPEMAARIPQEFPSVEHPLVRAHPASGRRALFLAVSMNHIVGLRRSESDALLSYLRTLIEDPNLQVRWQWRAFDFAIWDETSTNHRALSDHFPQRRKMRRCTIDGERPVFVQRAGRQATAA